MAVAGEKSGLPQPTAFHRIWWPLVISSYTYIYIQYIVYGICIMYIQYSFLDVFWKMVGLDFSLIYPTSDAFARKNISFSRDFQAKCIYECGVCVCMYEYKHCRVRTAKWPDIYHRWKTNFRYPLLPILLLRGRGGPYLNRRRVK